MHCYFAFYKSIRFSKGCSGFVQSVYNHFGVSITGTSDAMEQQAPTKFEIPVSSTDYSQMQPGDVCWWSGHVALYIGNGKIVHTNTKKTDPPKANLIHVSDLTEYRGHRTGNAKKMKCLRWVDSWGASVDDIANGVTSVDDVNSDSTQSNVIQARSTGLLVTESDLTGMPLEWSVKNQQAGIALLSRDDMSTEDAYIVGELQETINQRHDWASIVSGTTLIVGYLIILYGVVLILAYVLDLTNKFIDVSFTSILTLNKMCFVEDEADILKGRTSKVYVTKKGFFVRVFIIEVVGALLISGLLYRCIYCLCCFLII